MGETYSRVIELLKREFEEKKVTKYAFCKKTGINPTSVERYLCGISEPNQATLERLAAYFGVSVAWLRGEARDFIDYEEIEDFVRDTDNILELYDVSPEHLKETVKMLAVLFQIDIHNALKHFIAGNEPETVAICTLCFNKLEALTHAFIPTNTQEEREKFAAVMVEQLAEKYKEKGH